MGESLTNERTKIKQAAGVVEGRLLKKGTEKGLKIVGRDEWGNLRIESLSKREPDLLKRQEVPAEAVATPDGLRFIRAHPGILREIEHGSFEPGEVHEEGSGSLAVHPQNTDVMIKYVRFATTQTKVMDGTTYYLAQAATGIDLLRWKLMIQNLLESQRLTLAKPLFATRDVLVEEYVSGKVLKDFLSRQLEYCSPQEFESIAQTVSKITDEAQSGCVQIMQAESLKREDISHFPTIFDMRPPYGWLDTPVFNGKLVLHSSLFNWMIREDPSGIPNISTLTKEEQEAWLRNHLVLLDPFANFAWLTKEEKEQYQKYAIEKPSRKVEPSAPIEQEGTVQETQPEP